VAALKPFLLAGGPEGHMIITQTVEIPADRRVFFELPPELPIGRAQVELKIIPFTKQENPVPSATMVYNGIDHYTPISDSLVDILAHMGDMSIDEIRKERLAKHL
jgi:hypothetical protein